MEQIDGSPFATCGKQGPPGTTSSVTYEGLGQGRHAFALRVVDTARRPISQQLAVWTADTRVPVAYLAPLGAGTTYISGFEGHSGNLSYWPLPGAAAVSSVPLSFSLCFNKDDIGLVPPSALALVGATLQSLAPDASVACSPAAASSVRYRVV
eukprot:SM006653S20138  [mRNA]  locus=s6653:38:748:- [translate_table: standard]